MMREEDEINDMAFQSLTSIRYGLCAVFGQARFALMRFQSIRFNGNFMLTLYFQLTILSL